MPHLRQALRQGKASFCRTSDSGGGRCLPSAPAVSRLGVLWLRLRLLFRSAPPEAANQQYNGHRRNSQEDQHADQMADNPDQEVGTAVGKALHAPDKALREPLAQGGVDSLTQGTDCLLYTSDAADD